MDLAEPDRIMGSIDESQGDPRPSGPAIGLVLSGNTVIGHQVAHLLSSARGLQMQVADRDRQAYAHITRSRMHAVVADIDTYDLGGLAFLIYAKRHWPSVMTYAITHNEDAYIKQLACDMAGCHGFFYLSAGKPMLDMHAGMAAQLVEELPAGAATPGQGGEP